MDTKICKICKGSLQESFLYCPYCGKAINNSTSSSVDYTKVVLLCYEELFAGQPMLFYETTTAIEHIAGCFSLVMDTGNVDYKEAFQSLTNTSNIKIRRSGLINSFDGRLTNLNDEFRTKYKKGDVSFSYQFVALLADQMMFQFSIHGLKVSENAKKILVYYIYKVKYLTDKQSNPNDTISAKQYRPNIDQFGKGEYFDLETYYSYEELHSDECEVNKSDKSSETEGKISYYIPISENRKNYPVVIDPVKDDEIHNIIDCPGYYENIFSY